MEPLLPVLPSIFIGGVAYLLRDKIPWWMAVLLVFLFLIGLQVFIIASAFSIPIPQSKTISVELRVSLATFAPAIIKTALFFSALFLVFLLTGAGIEHLMRRVIVEDLPRYVVSTYITLLLFQLWVEVLPWTLLVPLIFYSS